jgi:hypothetical protein
LVRGRIGLVCAVLLLGAVAAACVPDLPPPPPQDHLVGVVNEYRLASRLPTVVENRAWSADAIKHARYMVETGILGHSEDPASPYYTPEGNGAATQSNAAGSYDPNASDRSFVDLWMAAPFHAVGILDPRLTAIGYGAYRNPSAPIPAAAALNVLSGLTGASTREVITFPGHGSTIGLTSYGREWPSPIKSCPGFGANAGLPLIVMLPDAERVINAGLSRRSEDVEVCSFDGTTYTNPEPAAQEVGRTTLANRNAIVVVPRNPLASGSTYTVTVNTSVRMVTWSFSVR